jgi:two-component system cell cycle response regulator DivK
MREKKQSSAVILVVDDCETNREILSLFLTASGYIVIEACNGVEAVRLATSECPDLIIMDLSMPVMDGFGAVRLLRKVPEVCEVPVVACTAHDTSTHRAQAMRVGFDEFLTKPIDFAKLDCVIDRFIKTDYKVQDLAAG